MPSPCPWNTPGGPLQLEEGEIHVWRADLDHNVDALPALEETLAPDESAKARRFRQQRDRMRYVFAHGVLRTILARYQRTTPSQLTFCYGPAGKPELGHGAVHFNMSHADGLVLVAISHQCDVGVDVERVRPDVDQVVAGWLGSPKPLRPSAMHTFFPSWVKMVGMIRSSR